MNILASVSRRTFVGLGLASMMTLGTSAAWSQEATTLKFATFVGQTSFLNVQIFEPWFKQIEAESGGSLKIEFLSGGSAAKPQEIIDSVRAGIVDIGWSITAYNPGRFNAAGVSELPLLIDGPVQGSAGMASLYEQGLLDGFDGVKVLGVGTADVARLHHTGDIGGLAGFKGAKVRAAGAVLSDMISRIGATPVGMPIPTVAESLAKGVLDGAASDWFALDGFRLIDVTKTHIDLPLGAAGIYLIMNKAKYDTLPDAAKAALDKYSVRDFSEFWSERLEAESNRVRELVSTTEGHSIITPNAEETATWEAAANEVIAAWSSSTANGEAILDSFRKGAVSQ